MPKRQKKIGLVELDCYDMYFEHKEDALEFARFIGLSHTDVDYGKTKGGRFEYFLTLSGLRKLSGSNNVNPKAKVPRFFQQFYRKT